MTFRKIAKTVQKSMLAALSEPFFLQQKNDEKRHATRGIFDEIVYAPDPTGVVEVVRDQWSVMVIDEEMQAITGEPIIPKKSWIIIRAADEQQFAIIDYSQDEEKSTYYLLQAIKKV